MVATASYEARAFGVHSGMPLRLAHRKCPDAVFLPSDHPAYDAASAEVMAALRSVRPSRRGLGLGRGGARRHLADPEAWPRSCRAAVLDADPADLRGRDRRDQGAGQDGDRLRESLAGQGVPAVVGELDDRSWAIAR